MSDDAPNLTSNPSSPHQPLPALLNKRVASNSSTTATNIAPTASPVASTTNISMPTPVHQNGYTTITVLPALNEPSPNGSTIPPPSKRTCCGMCNAVVKYVCSPSFLIKVLLLAILAALITLAIIFWSWVETAFVDSLAYIKQLGFVNGAIALIVANIIGAILFLPCVPFTLGAGFLFGLGWGSLIVIVATNVASLVAFITSRYFARSCVERRLGGKNSKFRLIDAAIKQDGFKIVCLVRSSPLHPYGICNYLFGITNVTLPSYALANLIAMTPGTILEVWTGTSIHELSDIISGKANQSAEQQIVFWVALGVTFVVTLIMTLWLKSKLNTEFNKYDDRLENLTNDVEFAALPSSTNTSVTHPNVALPTTDDTIHFENGVAESTDSAYMSAETSTVTTPASASHRLLEQRYTRSDSMEDHMVAIQPVRSLSRTNKAVT